jgi:AcrR family transcriptional regulator
MSSASWTSSGEKASEASVGRAPTQPRAKQTVTAILDATARLLLTTGAPVNLTAVAAEAGVSIGSLYQYFPTHGALMHALAERHLGSIGGAMVGEVTDASRQLGESEIRYMLRRYLDVADDPLQIAIMRAIRSDPVLRSLDHADTVTNAKRLARLALGGQGTAADLARAALQIEMVIDLAGAYAITLADLTPDEREPRVEAFIEMVTAASGG